MKRMTSGEEMRAERLKKLELLRAAGIDPYPVHSERTQSVAEFVASFDTHAESPETLSGRVLSIRKQGGIAFADIFDGTGRIQFVLQKTEMAEGAFELFDAAVDQGDFIEASGTAFTTKKGQESLLSKNWRMLAKSLSPLPDNWHGLEDPELKLRQRYLDILTDPELRAMFERKSAFWRWCATSIASADFWK